MKPSSFPVTYWCPPPLKAMDAAFLDELLDAGINLLLTPMFTGAPEETDAALALLDGCLSRGMEALLFDARVVYGSCLSRDDAGVAALDEAAYRARVQASFDQYGKHPAVRAFFVGDEPHKEDYAAICAASRVCRETTGKEGYVNLLPYYPKFLSATGCRDYEPYLEGFVRDSGSRILSKDFYAQIMENGEIHEDYWYVMRCQWEAARATGADIWHIVLATKHFDRGVPTVEDLRFEVNMSLAYGARAISYFTLLTPENHGPYETNFTEGPLDWWGEKTAVWDAVKKVDRELHTRWGDRMMDLEVRRISHYPTVPYTYRRPLPRVKLDPFVPDDLVYSVSLVRGTAPQDVVISEMRDQKTGEDYVFVANGNRRGSVAVRLTLNDALEMHRFDMNGAEYVAARQENGENGRLKNAFWLAAGQAELIRVVRK